VIVWFLKLGIKIRYLLKFVVGAIHELPLPQISRTFYTSNQHRQKFNTNHPLLTITDIDLDNDRASSYRRKEYKSSQNPADRSQL
jgi:hypothetical protein